MSSLADGKRPASVLVVDDNEDVREGLCDFLVEEGFCVRSAEDGGMAMADFAVNGTPDVVLLDLRMPNIDGYEFLRRQAAAPEDVRKVPVIDHKRHAGKALAGPRRCRLQETVECSGVAWRRTPRGREERPQLSRSSVSPCQWVSRYRLGPRQPPA